MKYWLSMVNTTEIDQFVAIAQHAEELGFSGISVPDHLIMPTGIESKYPYTEDGKVWWPDDNPWPDPWITLTALGAVTKRLRLGTNIYLAALRDPFTAARALATSAIFCQERVVCGVSAGWLKEEFEVLKLDFHRRGKRLDEMIEVIKLLLRGEPVAHSGEHFAFPEVILSPTPTQCPPIWVGGMSPGALRRAARHDGWLGVPMGNAQLAETIAKLFELRKEEGRYGEPFEVMLTPTELITVEFLEQLDDSGDYFLTALPWTPSPWGRAFWVEEGEDHRQLEVKIKAMRRFVEMMKKLGTWDS